MGVACLLGSPGINNLLKGVVHSKKFWNFTCLLFWRYFLVHKTIHFERFCIFIHSLYLISDALSLKRDFILRGAPDEIKCSSKETCPHAGRADTHLRRPGRPWAPPEPSLGLRPCHSAGWTSWHTVGASASSAGTDEEVEPRARSAPH